VDLASRASPRVAAALGNPMTSLPGADIGSRFQYGVMMMAPMMMAPPESLESPPDPSPPRDRPIARVDPVASLAREAVSPPRDHPALTMTMKPGARVMMELGVMMDLGVMMALGEALASLESLLAAGADLASPERDLPASQARVHLESPERDPTEAGVDGEPFVDLTKKFVTSAGAHGAAGHPRMMMKAARVNPLVSLASHLVASLASHLAAGADLASLAREAVASPPRDHQNQKKRQRSNISLKKSTTTKSGEVLAPLASPERDLRDLASQARDLRDLASLARDLASLAKVHLADGIKFVL
jgi:hypothetical protein